MPKELAKRIAELITESIDTKRRLLESDCAEILAEMAVRAAEAIAGGGKLMLCGNGGSAADAQHLAAEMLIRLRPHINRSGIPALTLATDTSTLTACGNDYGYDEIFERPLLAIGRPGDVLLAITTSGKSPNVIRALAAARDRGIATFGFLGCDGGPALEYCDKAIVVPSTVTGRIQECHIVAGHALMELIEDILLERGHIVRQTA